jgi:hypothetical protein
MFMVPNMPGHGNENQTSEMVEEITLWHCPGFMKLECSNQEF